MTVAVVAFAGFNELDVLANLHILNRVTRTRPNLDLVARLVGPTPTLHSMYDLDVTLQAPLDSVADGRRVDGDAWGCDTGAQSR